MFLTVQSKNNLVQGGRRLDSPRKRGKTILIDVALVYPYVDPKRNKSIFRFPPLGLGYLASYLLEHGFSVSIQDATFNGIAKTMESTKALRPRIVGVYSMFTMREASLKFAREIADSCELLVAGGPLPSIDPEAFLNEFDVVVEGEGEETLLELVKGMPLNSIRGIVYRHNGSKLLRAQAVGSEVAKTPGREPIKNLDSIPLPARELFDNRSYIDYYRKIGGPSVTSIISSRGCPFSCDFCSRPVFGSTFRERSPGNIVDEVEQVIRLGYDRIFFQDDCFTLTKRRVQAFCDEVKKRGLHFGWECLSRVDTLDGETARRMREAGCDQIFLGLESGSDRMLGIMKKSATSEQGRRAVEAAHCSGLRIGAFFIIGYPGDDDDSMLETMRFASRLPLDYLSFTLPYPIPGTGLYDRVGDRLLEGLPEPKQRGLIQHQLIYYSEISEAKLKFGIAKAITQHRLRRRLGRAAPLVVAPFEILTDSLFRLI
jgi:anaerobic magnesium-protoporphyrin IX monomethyl ester cyclase